MNAASRAAIVAAASVCAATALSPVAAADTAVIHTLGSPAQLVNGDVVQAWTISDLKPSTDAIPYPVAGTLWEATATDVAMNGTVQPVVSNLNARARTGQTYRVLFGVATPQGVNPSVLSQGQQTTGKVYFDITGDIPDSVVYSAGGPDLAVWVMPPPAASASPGSGLSTPGVSGGGTASAPAAGTTPPLPAAQGTLPATAPAGSTGTPVVPGSQGTPVAGSTGTPVGPASAGTPLAPASPGAQIPGSAGTPVPPTGTGPTAAAETAQTLPPATPPAAGPTTPVSPPAASAGTPASSTPAAPVPGQTSPIAPTTTLAPSA